MASNNTKVTFYDNTTITAGKETVTSQGGIYFSYTAPFHIGHKIEGKAEIFTLGSYVATASETEIKFGNSYEFWLNPEANPEDFKFKDITSLSYDVYNRSLTPTNLTVNLNTLRELLVKLDSRIKTLEDKKVDTELTVTNNGPKIYNGAVQGFDIKSNNSGKFAYTTDNTEPTEDTSYVMLTTNQVQTINISTNATTKHIRGKFFPSDTLYTTKSINSFDFVINKKQVKFQSGGKIIEYNDNPLRFENVTVATGYSLVNNHYFSYEMLNTSVITNVGQIDNMFTLNNITYNGINVSDNYNILSPIYGKLTVNQKNVTFTSGSYTKVYDGSELTYNLITLTSGSLVTGHKLTYHTTGKQTSVGSSKNTFVIDNITSTGSTVDKQSNYNITKVEGDLTVTQQTVNYYYYAGWDCPTSLSELAEKAKSPNGGVADMTKTYTKNNPLRLYDGEVTNPTRGQYFVVVPNGISLYDSEGEVSVLGLFTEITSISISNHKIYQYNTAVKAVGGLMLR